MGKLTELVAIHSPLYVWELELNLAAKGASTHPYISIYDVHETTLKVC